MPGNTSRKKRATRRLLAAYRREGAAALVHGNCGREPANKLDVTVEAEIVRLARGEYHDYNDCHFAEELAERHEIHLSRPTVRRVRRAGELTVSTSVPPRSVLRPRIQSVAPSLRM